MKTMYYETSNFIRHTGNLIDLEELRARQALAQRDSLARRPEELYEAEEPEFQVEPEETGFQPVVITLSRSQRRRARRIRRAWTLDAYASLAVIFMTLAFTLRVLF